MKKIITHICSLVSTLSFLSCAEGYNITGTSLQSAVTADMVYLKSIDDGKSVDSTKLVHGKFSMSGPIDSIVCVRMLFDDLVEVPVILEQGDIQISAFNTGIKVTGTPLNDRLYSFLDQRDSLLYILNELPHKETTMILDGYDEAIISKQILEEEIGLRMALDKLETDFVKSNFDNVLGVTYFMSLCEKAKAIYGSPTTTPQIDAIYGLAPDAFRNNKRIAEYMRLCEGQINN